MLIHLVFWICTNGQMTDCTVWRGEQFKGAQSYNQCLKARTKAMDQLQQKAPKAFVRVECEPARE